MYAVVRTGGKQYRVTMDEVVIVERLAGEPGQDIELGQVLALDDGKDTVIGSPLVDGARVFGTVIEQGKTAKVIIFKKKRRKNHRRTRGHRQQVTVLRISDILAKGQERTERVAAPKKAAAPKTADEGEATTEAKKPAAKKAPVRKTASTKKETAKKAPAKKAAARKPASKKTKE